ncbi:MAG TPA: hypothetical protein VGD87_17285 [Archangium sp.]
MSADERRHGPVELAELPGRPGYSVEGEEHEEPAHAKGCTCETCAPCTSACKCEKCKRHGCNCLPCRARRESPGHITGYVHRRVEGPLWQTTAACGVVRYAEAYDTINGPRFTSKDAEVTCPACLAKP